MNSICRKTTYCLCFLILTTTTIWAEAVQVIEKQCTLSATGPTTIQGAIAPGTEESWHFTMTRGKEARVRIINGRPGVVFDVYDADNIAANEGVDEKDWFPVSPGRYKITVINATGLEKKNLAKTVPYLIRIEIR